MKKQFLKLFKKTILFCALLVISMAAHAIAIIDGTGSSCIPDVTGTPLTYQLTGTSGTTNYLWVTKGDIAISGSATGSTVSITSTGKGKGRLILYYDVVGSTCPRAMVYYDIYKVFQTTPVLNPIVGPTCVNPGDTVTYSVTPWVSTNIFSEIGIDRYYWTIPTSWKPIKYASADSSSITFIVGTLSGSDTIRVDIGQCNLTDNKETKLGIKKKVDPPVLVSAPTCVSSATTLITLSVSAVSGISYQWAIPSNWSFNTPANGQGSSVTVNIDGNPGDVSVTATSANGCNAATTKHFVTRGVPSNATVIGPTCVDKNTQYTYSLSSAPINSKFTWKLPNGWSFVSPQDGSSVIVQPGSSAVNGYIVVKATTCSTDSFRLAVKINSGQGLAFGIVDLEECLYRATASGFNKTGATFAWTLNSTPMGTYVGVNTIQLPCGSDGNLCVRITRTSDCLDTTFCTTIVNCSCSSFKMSAGSKEITDIKNAYIYPNPAKDMISIELPGGQDTEIAILDNAGRTLYTTRTKKALETINVGRFDRGSYLISLKTDEKVVIKKLILD